MAIDETLECLQFELRSFLAPEDTVVVSGDERALERQAVIVNTLASGSA
jgi:hypothetical protein